LKISPCSITIKSPQKTTNLAESFGGHAFEGEGDVFSSKQRNARPPKLQYHTQNSKGPISMREGDALGGFDPHQL
jgi:hypothetical protein